MKDKATHFFQACASYMKERKIQVVAAIVFMAAALYLFLGSWVRTDVEHYCEGVSGWTPELSQQSADFTQSFTPVYSHLEELGICFRNTDMITGEGVVSFWVCDENGDILYEAELSYDQLSDKYYMFDVNLDLDTGKNYYINVEFQSLSYGDVSILLCGDGDYMEENTALYQGGTPLEGQQLATYYVYENALTRENAIKAAALILLAAILAAVGCPFPSRYRKFFAILLLLVGPYVLGQRLELLTVSAGSMMGNAMQWNLGFMYLLEIILLLIIRNPGLTVAVSNGLLTLLYTVNYFVYNYRGTAFKISDVILLRTVSTVIGSYHLTPNIHLAMAWLLATVFVVCGFVLRAKNQKGVWVFRTAGLILAAVSVYILAGTDFILNQGFVIESGMDEWYTYNYNGYLVGTFIDIRRSVIEEPEGYTSAKAKDLLSEYTTETVDALEEDLPNIVLIADESFSDLRVLGNLELSEENMSFFNSLTENTIRGYVNVSVLGGGTANTEFEVLTGGTMAFLPSSYYPFFHNYSAFSESLVSQLKENGYVAYSMHPMTSQGYNRKTVYASFGFDESYWGSDFEDAELVRTRVSDQATYDKIIEIFENKEEDERAFVYDLTMQNHGDYDGNDLEITVTAGDLSTSEADLYLSLIRISDEAFESLISYFEDYDEKVIVCMFGDHQPKFSDTAFEEGVYAATEGQTQEEITFNRYKTPFVIWANYDLEEETDLDISTNYLGALLLETAGVPLSPYFQYLSELMEEYPVITANGYKDASGSYYSWSGDDTEFSDYRILQYHYLFG